MRRWLVAAFLLMGISFTILQALIIRELMVSFSGNELSIGLILGAWLVLEALGSGLAGRFARRVPPRPASYAWLQLLLALLLLPSLLVALRVRILVGAVPGEVIAPLPAFLSALLVLAPLGLVDGAMFTAACRVRVRMEQGNSTLPPGRIYVLEAAGSIVGGVAFTYLLLPLLNSTQILLLVAGLNLASACSLFWARLRRQVWAAPLAGLLAVAALVIAASPLGTTLHRQAVKGRWSPYNLVYEGNSDYGNVAVIEEYDQITVFANGTPVLTSPDPDIATIEHLTDLPMLFLDQPPGQVLVIGGGAGGVLDELQRYSSGDIFYAELDPLLIQTLQEVPTPLTQKELSAPNLQLELSDGRRFVQDRVDACSIGPPCAPFDLVLVNLPYPSTLELNRLYTQEFFELVRSPSILAEKGLLVLPAPSARTYMSPVTRDLLAAYASTLGSVFPHVRAIPADGLTIWLASSSNPLDLDAEELTRRLQAGGRQTQVLRGDYLRYLLNETVVAGFTANLETAPSAEINRDGYPSGLRYALAYESALLSPDLEPFFRSLGNLRWQHVAAGIALLTLAGLLLARRREVLVPLAIASSGVFGMTADLLIIFTFQVLYGYVYQQVGLLITAFMAGLSGGGLIMTRWAGRLQRPWRVLTGLEAAIAAGGAGLAGLLFLLLGRLTPASWFGHALLLLLNVAAGALVGLEFPLAHSILQESSALTSRVAGALYASDLVGATLGAVALSAVLLPALGLVETALLVALLKAGSLLLVGTGPWRGRWGSPR